MIREQNVDPGKRDRKCGRLNAQCLRNCVSVTYDDLSAHSRLHSGKDFCVHGTLHSFLMTTIAGVAQVGCHCLNNIRCFFRVSKCRIFS